MQQILDIDDEMTETTDTAEEEIEDCDWIRKTNHQTICAENP